VDHPTHLNSVPIPFAGAWARPSSWALGLAETRARGAGGGASELVGAGRAEARRGQRGERAEVRASGDAGARGGRRHAAASVGAGGGAGTLAGAGTDWRHMAGAAGQIDELGARMRRSGAARPTAHGLAKGVGLADWACGSRRRGAWGRHMAPAERMARGSTGGQKWKREEEEGDPRD
jgi:hypothetical protein